MSNSSVQAVKQTQREHAYQYVRRKLMEGAFPAGTRLSPIALAREIGTSHTPVREAISQLQSEGLIEYSAHRGAFVKEGDRHDLVDLIEMRTIVECQAASLAARRISPVQLQELDEAWEGLCRTATKFDIPPGTDPRPPLQEWLLHDLVFHMVLIRAAGNRHLLRVIEDLRIMTQMFGYRSDPPAAWKDPVTFVTGNLRVHQDVYEAVRRRDSKAARRAMMVHMRRARRNLLSRFDWLQRQDSLNSALAKEFPDSVRDLVHDVAHHRSDRRSVKQDKPSGNEDAKNEGQSD